MQTLIDKIPYAVLIPLAVFMLLAPFLPEPHVVEKLRMLKAGTLKRPLDIFDLFLHGTPVALLLLKVGLDVKRRLGGSGDSTADKG